MQLLHDLGNLTNDFVVSTKPFVEWLFYVGGIILCIVGIRGLKQIKLGLTQIELLKTDILSRSERSAKEKAIEASEKLLLEATGSYFAFQQELLKRGLTHYKGKIGDFKHNEFPDLKNLPDNEKGRVALTHQWLITSNRFEGIAAMFTSGVADEQTGFEVIGLDFVETVRNNYDYYTLIQRFTDGQNTYFPNTIRLYKCWFPRFTQKELEAQKNLLDEKLKNLEKPIIPPLKPTIE